MWKNKYQAVIVTKQLQPLQFCKRFIGNVDKRDLFWHIQDIEDYYDKSLLNSFYTLISSLSEAKKIFGITYELGYSNYSFELWVLLHVANMSQTLSTRKDYLKYINKYFKKKYKRFEEFKNEKEFVLILKNFVTIESVTQAISNANKIVSNNFELQKPVSYKKCFPQKGTIFFRDRIIDENIKKGKTLKAIIDIYNDKNLFDKDYIKIEYEKFLDKIRMRKKEWDIKVSDFIIENIGKHQLFFDPNHPTNFFIKYVSDKVLKILGVNSDELIAKPKLTLDSYQMPICASIIDYFGLDYDLNNNEIRNHGRKIYKCHINLKKYIIQYYCYIWQDSSFPIIQRVWSFLLHSLLGSFGLIISAISYVKRKVLLIK